MDESIAHTLGALRGGVPVEVTGPPGSGKSHFLGRISAHLSSQGWVVQTVSAREDGTGSLASADRPRDRLTAPHLLSVDDADSLSPDVLFRLGKLAEAERSALILSRSGPLNLGGGLMDAHQVTMRSVEYPYFRASLVDALGGPVTPDALSQLYAATGGQLGVAFAVVRHLRRARRLRLDDGVWQMAGGQSLYLPAMGVLMESLLGHLTSDERTTLQAIVDILPAEFPTVLDRVTTSPLRPEASLMQLDSLGESGVIEVVGDMVVMRVPMLADHVLATTSSVRRALLNPQVRGTMPMSAPVFSALLAGRERQELHSARAAWAEAQTKPNATALVEAMMDADASTEDVERIIVASKSLPASQADERAWSNAATRFYAFVGDFDAAVPLALSPTGQAEFRIMNGDPVLVPALTATSSDEDRTRIAGCRYIRGDAAGALDALGDGTPDEHSYSATIRSMALVAVGRLREASELSATRMNQAVTDNDRREVLRFAFVSGYTAFMRGRLDSVSEVLQQVQHLGTPRSEAVSVLGLAVLSAAVNARERAPSTTSPTMHGTSCWPMADARWVEIQRHHRSAAALPRLLELGEELEARQHWMAAAHARLVAADLSPTDDNLDALRACLTHTNASALQEQAEVIYAACGGDIEALTGYAEAFEADSRAEHARRAWEHVRVLAAVNGKSELAAEAAARAETLRRRPAGATPLTPREREVVRLVASGHSSAAIAKALFLSVRTVDTHIGRAMRKAGVRSRRDLQHL